MLSCIFELYDYPACCHSLVCWSKSWSVSGRTRKPCSIMFTLDSWHLLSKSSAKTLRPRLQNSWHHSGCSDDSNSVPSTPHYKAAGLQQNKVIDSTFWSSEAQILVLLLIIWRVALWPGLWSFCSTCVLLHVLCFVLDFDVVHLKWVQQ